MRLLFALASGIFLALTFAPYDLSLLAWFAPAALILVSIDARPWVAFLGGFLHGMGFCAISIPWVYTVMRVHGGLNRVEAGGVAALFFTAFSVFPGVFAWAVRQVGRKGIARACLAAPFLWVTTEFARTHLPSIGFPWNLLGYGVSNSLGLLQLVTWTGIFGLSFLVMVFNGVFAWLLLQRTRRAWITWLVFAGVLFPFLVVGGRLVPAPIGQQQAHLVQVNLPQEGYGADWKQRFAADLAEIESLTVSAGQKAPGLVIWPEAPAPFTLGDADFAARARRIAAASQSYFLVGVVEWRPASGRWDGPYNSAVLLALSGERVFTYDKIHLVAFGEYVPWSSVLRFARHLTAEVSAFKPGSTYAVGKLPGGTFGALICFEAAFPDLVRQFTANGAELLINISNDGWFGRSSAPEQHLAIARVRAAENRRWLLRATNNGHTVVVDPYGRIVARLAPDTRSVLTASFAFRSDRTLYSRFGDWIAWLSLAASVGFVAAAFRRART
jgi:apolipoprotein N-acyltransferase